VVVFRCFVASRFAWRVERVGAQARRMGSLEFTPGIENLNKPIEE